MNTNIMSTETQIITNAIIEKISAAFPNGLDAKSQTALANINIYDSLPELSDEDGEDYDEVEICEALKSACKASATNECGDTIYDMDGAIIHVGESHTCITDDESIRDCLISGDWDTYPTKEDLLTAFGLDPELDEADEDYEGECKVWVSYNYCYNHINPPTDGWVTEDNYDKDIITFDNYAAAAAWIEETEDSARGYRTETNPRGCYVLSHGEYATPDYTICKA